jgi:hypothetical protein
MKTQRRTVALLAIAAALLCLAVAGLAFWRAERALTISRLALSSAGNFRVFVRTITPLPNPGFATMLAPAVFTAGASFDGQLYLSGPGGLYAYSQAGTLAHIYGCGLELPAVPLGQMAVGTLADAHQPELLIATRGEGVLAFDGTNFRQIRPGNPDSRQITALLPLASGSLLLGTVKQGLLVYDGKTLKTFEAATNEAYITSLAGTGSDLWIGTLNHGILHWHGGETETIAEDKGLPDAGRASRTRGPQPGCSQGSRHCMGCRESSKGCEFLPRRRTA